MDKTEERPVQLTLDEALELFEDVCATQLTGAGQALWDQLRIAVQQCQDDLEQALSDVDDATKPVKGFVGLSVGESSVPAVLDKKVEVP